MAYSTWQYRISTMIGKHTLDNKPFPSGTRLVLLYETNL
jgi:hypothetical protein